MNSQELKAMGAMTLQEIGRQVDALAQYLSKFPQHERRRELTRWINSKDFEASDAVEIVLVLFLDRGFQ